MTTDVKTNDSWATRVSRWFTFLRTPKPEVDAPEPSAPHKATLTDPFDKLDAILSLNVDGYLNIVNALKTQLYKTADYFQSLGFNDGVLGVKNGIYSMTATYGRTFKEQAKAEIEGMKESLEQEKKLKEEIKRGINEEHDEVKKYLDFINIHYRYNTNAYSFTLFCFYGLIGMFLFVSDIPLALELISKGFSYLSSPLHPLSDLFIDPLGVFIYNWETFFTAFGIAFITVYIKMYYDDYIGPQEGIDLIRHEKLRQDHISDGVAFKKELRNKFWIRTLILLFVFALLGLLAFFRYHSASQIIADAGGAAPGAPASSLNSPWLSITVFFFITLMLPFIAGICFSISLKTIQNIRRKKAAEKLFNTKKEHLETAARNVNDVIKQIKIVQGILSNWVVQGSFENEIQAFFMSYYNTGYNLGIPQPEKFDGVEDYFTRIKMMRNKVAGRKMFDVVRDSNHVKLN